jgi:signal transduction histidine kinase
VRRRILGSILAVTAIALVLLGVPLAMVISRLDHSQEVTRLQREATLAAGAVPASGLGGADPIEPPTADGRPTLFGYYGLDGRLVYGKGPALADPATRSAAQGRVTQRSAAGHLVVAVPIATGETVTGAVRADASLGPVNARIYRSWAVIGLLGAAALGVAAIIGHRQARRLANPVTRLARTMSELGEGDFTARFQPATGIPEVDHAGRALDRTAANLSELVERERSFSADVSHQLRTPLAGLRLTLETALLADDQTAHETLVGAVAEVDRLEATVEELLAHARNTGRPQAIVDFEQIVAVADSRWHGRLAADGRPLRTTVGQVEPVRASATALTQILDVLLDNAFTHGQGAVTVTVRRAGPGTAVDVSDEGPGIDRDPEAIFGRGVSLSNSHDGNGHTRNGQESNGIGLALARGLAQSQGGQLVLARRGPGPTFSLILPPCPPS